MKTAREKLGLNLQDMAFLLDMDFSNLSKYERSEIKPNIKLVLSYFILTGQPLEQMFHFRASGLIKGIAFRITSLITRLEENEDDPHVKKRIDILYEALKNVCYLQELSETNHED